MIVTPRLRSTLWGAAWTYLGVTTSAWCLRTACLRTTSASTPAPAPIPARSIYPVFCSNADGSRRVDVSMRAEPAGWPRRRWTVRGWVGIGKANARWCFGYGRATVAHWCGCKQLKFTWYSNLIRKELNSISGGCPYINWGVSAYQLGGVPLPLPLINQ